MATTAKKTTKTSNSTDNKRVKELEAQIAQLSEMVQLLTKGAISANNTNAGIDRDVTFVSLCNNILNLSTEPYGGGTIYTFNEFGEEQSVPYSDARLLIRNNKRFIKEGKCYIADEEIINAEHLSKDYERLLGKEEMIDLLTKDRITFEKIFGTMTDSQKEAFKGIVANRLSKDKNSVDMNIVQKINDALNIDILKDIEFSKGLFEMEN